MTLLPLEPQHDGQGSTSASPPASRGVRQRERRGSSTTSDAAADGAAEASSAAKRLKECSGSLSQIAGNALERCLHNVRPVVASLGQESVDSISGFVRDAMEAAARESVARVETYAEEESEDVRRKLKAQTAWHEARMKQARAAGKVAMQNREAERDASFRAQLDAQVCTASMACRAACGPRGNTSSGRTHAPLPFATPAISCDLPASGVPHMSALMVMMVLCGAHQSASVATSNDGSEAEIAELRGQLESMAMRLSSNDDVMKVTMKKLSASTRQCAELEASNAKLHEEGQALRVRASEALARAASPATRMVAAVRGVRGIASASAPTLRASALLDAYSSTMHAYSSTMHAYSSTMRAVVPMMMRVYRVYNPGCARDDDAHAHSRRAPRSL